MEAVVVPNFSAIGQRIDLFFSFATHLIRLNQHTVAVQIGGSVFEPPVAADFHAEAVSLAEPITQQGKISGEFLLNVIDMNRIVAVATDRGNNIHRIGEPTRIGGIELHERSVFRLGGKVGRGIPNIAVIRLVGTAVCRIIDIEILVHANRQGVGEVNRRYGITGYTDSIEVAAIQIVYATVENIGARGVENTVPYKDRTVGNRQRVDTRSRDGRKQIACTVYRIEGTRFGYHAVGEAYAFRTADNPVCQIAFKLVILAMRNREEHTVDHIATEFIRYFLHQPDTFGLLVGFTQYIGGMRGIGIDEMTVATGNPMRRAADSRIGSQDKVGVVVNRIVHTGFRTDRPQQDAGLFAHQRTVPGAEVLAERPNAEHFVSGKVLGGVVQVFVFRAGNRRGRIGFVRRHIPLQIGFFNIVTFGHTEYFGMHIDHHIAVFVGTSRIDLRRDNHFERIGGEYHQGGHTLVADTVGSARQTGFNPAYDIVVGTVLRGLLPDIDNIEYRRIERHGIALFIARGGEESVHIPTVLRIGSAVGNIGFYLVFAVGTDRIQFQAQIHPHIGLRNRNHGKYTRFYRTVDRIVAFGGIHIQDSINLATDGQVFKGYRIAPLNKSTVQIPFDIPIVAAVGEYRAGIGNGGKQTGGFTHADTQGIIVDMAVRLNVDTGFLGLFHHNGIHNRVLAHPQADSVILNDYRNFIGRCRGEVGTLQSQTVEVVARLPESATTVPDKVHIGLVVRFNTGNRRELASPASCIGQTEVVFHKVNRTAVSYLNRGAVGTELTTVSIGKHHLNRRVVAVGNHHTDGVGSMARIPEHCRTRRFGYPQGGRIIAANRQRVLHQLRIGRTNAAYHRYAQRSVAETVGMRRYGIGSRCLYRRKEADGIGGVVVPSVGSGTGNPDTHRVAQAERIGSGHIDRSRNGLRLAGIIGIAASRVGSRTVVVGKNHHIHTVAVLHVIASVRGLVVEGGHAYAVMIPTVLRRIAVFGVIGSIKRIGEAAEQGVIHTDAYLAFDRFGYGNIYVEYYRIDGHRTGRQRQRGVVGINHRCYQRAVRQLTQILDKRIIGRHKRTVHIPIHRRRGTEIRAIYKCLNILLFANLRNRQFSGGNHGTYTQYRIAIAIGVQLNAIYALTGLGINIVNAVGGVIVLPQITVCTRSHKFDAVELHQVGIDNRFNRTAYRRCPAACQHRRAAYRIGGGTIHGGVNHYINAVSRLNVHAGIRRFSIYGIHMNTIVEPLVLRIVAVGGVVRSRKGIAGRTEERIGNRNLDIGFDGVFELNGIFNHHRIQYGTSRIVNRINHGANLAAVGHHA